MPRCLRQTGWVHASNPEFNRPSRRSTRFGVHSQRSCSLSCWPSRSTDPAWEVSGSGRYHFGRFALGECRGFCQTSQDWVRSVQRCGALAGHCQWFSGSSLQRTNSAVSRRLDRRRRHGRGHSPRVFDWRRFGSRRTFWCRWRSRYWYRRRVRWGFGRETCTVGSHSSSGKPVARSFKQSLLFLQFRSL